MLPSLPRIRSLAVALLSLSRVALAQGGAPEGTIGGRVLDDAGQPVRHARVVARDVRTGAERCAAADATGHYLLRALPAGRYAVQVRALGYRPVAAPERALGASEELALDFRLVPAATALTRQVVTATRSAVSIAAVPGAVTVVGREQIEEQARAAPRLGPMLAQLVPGLGAATENLQQLRAKHPRSRDPRAHRRRAAVHLAQRVARFRQHRPGDGRAGGGGARRHVDLRERRDRRRDQHHHPPG